MGFVTVRDVITYGPIDDQWQLGGIRHVTCVINTVPSGEPMIAPLSGMVDVVDQLVAPRLELGLSKSLVAHSRKSQERLFIEYYCLSVLNESELSMKDG